MINIPNFDSVIGKTFIDKQRGGSDMVAIGYGDNPGNPYIIGMIVHKDPNGPDKATFRTVLLKDVEFTL